MHTASLFEMEPSWKEVLKEELTQSYLIQLMALLEKERALGKEIYPPKDLVFNAFWQTPYDQVKVVIVGQDPYHGRGQAHGLSFSVPQGVPPPPSLKNIFKEIKSDLDLPVPEHGCLIKWAKQGVLLLNAILTVQEGLPLSYQGKGWERFTDAVIAKLYERSDPVIFVLWGKYAQEKCMSLKGGKNQPIILKAAHPSPFSVQNFLGCRHFSQVNEHLMKMGKTPIDWTI
jgi:uracil-DNA glycosylase